MKLSRHIFSNTLDSSLIIAIYSPLVPDLKTGLISEANGSAYIELEKTKLTCGVYVTFLLHLGKRKPLSLLYVLQEAVLTDSLYLYMHIFCRSYGPRPVKRAGQGFSDRGTLNCEIKFATFSCVKRRGTMRVKTTTSHSSKWKERTSKTPHTHNSATKYSHTT